MKLGPKFCRAAASLCPRLFFRKGFLPKLANITIRGTIRASLSKNNASKRDNTQAIRKIRCMWFREDSILLKLFL
jgi:hypothetical protein